MLQRQQQRRLFLGNTKEKEINRSIVSNKLEKCLGMVGIVEGAFNGATKNALIDLDGFDC